MSWLRARLMHFNWNWAINGKFSTVVYASELAEWPAGNFSCSQYFRCAREFLQIIHRKKNNKFSSAISKFFQWIIACAPLSFCAILIKYSSPYEQNWLRNSRINFPKARKVFVSLSVSPNLSADQMCCHGVYDNLFISEKKISFEFMTTQTRGKRVEVFWVWVFKCRRWTHRIMIFMRKCINIRLMPRFEIWRAYRWG